MRSSIHRSGLKAGVFIVLLSFGGNLPSSVAQEAEVEDVAQEASAQEEFSDVAQVVEVLIPINVASKNGEPIRGLTRDDFEIYDRRVQQEITHFREVDLEAIDLEGTEREWIGSERERPPLPTRAEIERSVPSEARRHILLLFDLSFSSPSAILRARQAARAEILESLHPTDLVGVATHTVEKGPVLVLTFTPDRAQLARAIDSLGAPRLVRRSDPLSFVLRGPLYDAEWGGPGGRNSAFNLGGPGANLGVSDLTIIGKQISRQEKSFDRGRVFSWAASMGELARMLNSVQGRKQIVYFSEGFDGRLLFGRRPDADDPAHVQEREAIVTGQYWMVDSNDTYGSVPLQTELASTLEEFRRANSSIYAVDITGLQADSAEQGRIESVGKDSLFYIANDTGGKFFSDANNIAEPLMQALKETVVTYVVGFRPTELEHDGSYHKVRVQVRATRGARVHHREGYYAPRPYEELHPFEKNLLAADAIASAAPRDELGVSVLAVPFRANDQSSYVPVIIEVDGPSLLQDQKDEFLNVELYGYVTDEFGEMKDFFSEIVGVKLSANDESFRAGGLKYYGHVELDPGNYLLRVLVRNAKTGRVGVESVPVSIPTFGDEPVVLPPFFVDTSRRWVLVRERQGNEFEGSVVYPFTVNGEPFIPSVRPVVGVHGEAQICLVAYNLGDGELNLDSALVDDRGQPVMGGSLALLERTVTGISGFDKLLFAFRPGGLQDGDYRLEVAFKDSQSGVTTSTSAPIQVRR